MCNIFVQFTRMQLMHICTLWLGFIKHQRLYSWLQRWDKKKNANLRMTCQKWPFVLKYTNAKANANPTSTTNGPNSSFFLFFYLLFYCVVIKIIRFYFPLSILILLFWAQFFDWILQIKNFKMQKHSISARPFYNKMILKWRTIYIYALYICMLYAYSV